MYRGTFAKFGQQKFTLQQLYDNNVDAVMQSPAIAFLKKLQIKGFIRKWKDGNMTVHKGIIR
jgi:hypothetical protein